MVFTIYFISLFSNIIFVSISPDKSSPSHFYTINQIQPRILGLGFSLGSTSLNFARSRCHTFRFYILHQKEDCINKQVTIIEPVYLDYNTK